MALIDRQYLARPYYGSRRMAAIVASKPKIAFDFRREPTAGKLHGGICGGGAG
jgi:hypothetical protein